MMLHDFGDMAVYVTVRVKVRIQNMDGSIYIQQHIAKRGCFGRKDNSATDSCLRDAMEHSANFHLLDRHVAIDKNYVCNDSPKRRLIKPFSGRSNLRQQVCGMIRPPFSN